MSEWFGSRSRRILTRVSAAVQLIDDLTGLPVNGSNARVWIEGHKPPIKKSDGISIFTDLPAGEHTIIAEGGQYARTQVPFTADDKTCGDLIIRLLPNKLYPVSLGTVRIEGKAFPDAAVRVWSGDKSGALKLLHDAKKGSGVIGIYTGSDENIEGRLLKIASSDDKGEYVRVTAAVNKERSEYKLSGELTADYPKIGTAVIQVCECRADSSGDFMLLIKKGGGTLVCEAQSPADGKLIQKTINIGNDTYVKAELVK